MVQSISFDRDRGIGGGRAMALHFENRSAVPVRHMDLWFIFGYGLFNEYSLNASSSQLVQLHLPGYAVSIHE